MSFAQIGVQVHLVHAIVAVVALACTALLIVIISKLSNLPQPFVTSAIFYLAKIPRAP